MTLPTVLDRSRKTPARDRAELEAILQRCGRNHILEHVGAEWRVRSRTHDRIVDRDYDFNTLYHRCADWSEDVPGYEGRLWWAPTRMAGEVCIKGTRVLAKVVAAFAADGEDPRRDWPHITRAQIDAAIAYTRAYHPPGL